MVMDEAPPQVISAGDVIGRALAVLSGNFFAFFAITAICFVPGMLWTAYVGALVVGVLDGLVPSFVSAALMVGGMVVSWLMCSFVSQAVMIGTTVESMAQRSGALSSAFMLGIWRLPQVIAVSLAAAMAPLVILALAIGGLVLLKVSSPLLAVATVAGGIMGAGAVACALFVAVPAVVVERVSVAQALDRSWTLTRGSRIPIFAALFVVAIAQAVITGLAKAAMPFEMGKIAVDLLLSLLSGAFGATLGAVTYVRLRETSEQVHASRLLDGLALLRKGR
jgi:hypothetical protein